MPAVYDAELPIIDSLGRAVGNLQISTLPKSKDAIAPVLLDHRSLVQDEPELDPVQLLEGAEYRYEFTLHKSVAHVRTDRRELFDAETDDGLKGRLRPGQIVGTVPCCVFGDEIEVGSVSFEVRSRKLNYLDQYRWMLQDIAEAAVEAILERFGPAEQRFGVGDTGDPKSLYQSFAFLQSMLTTDAFTAAVNEVLHRPHITWEPSVEAHRPGQGLPPSSGVARQIAKAGPRVDNPSSAAYPSLPRQLSVSRQEPAVDNPPNRFVKHALKSWRDYVVLIHDRLRREKDTAPVQRGLRETARLQSTLDSWLGHKALMGVSDLDAMPLGSQVHQKRSGYRDILRAYLQFQTTAHLRWAGAEDVFSAGQRDVAALYEYWVFLQLADIVGSLIGKPLDSTSLFDVSSSGLTLLLRRGHEAAVRGEVEKHGRRFDVRLFFNRAFGSGSSEGTWSRPMRPDCSLRIAPFDEGPSSPAPVWVHFDAKYRVEVVSELFGAKNETSTEDAATLDVLEHADEQGHPLRTDLLKMHAYRDAIRRSAGAYVLYPGDVPEQCEEYHELLPGLGAFGLKPTSVGPALGTQPLRSFLEAVIEHLANQATQHERARYWSREVYERALPQDTTVATFAPFLDRPPQDTLVLLGFARSKEHLDWIHRLRLYNMRADQRRGSVGLASRELAAQLVLIYEPQTGAVELWRTEGDPCILDRDEIANLGYPSPRGKLYYCVSLSDSDIGPWGRLPTCEEVIAMRSRLAPSKPWGAPVSVTWLQLTETLSVK